MYAATNGTYTLFLVEDSDPVNPRKDYEPFGRMVCWHRRYNLGDAHDYDSPIDFLRDLYRHSILDNAQRLVQYLKEKKARSAYLQYNRHTHEWDLYGYYSLRTVLGNSEPEWEIAEAAPASQLNAGGWFFDAMLNVLTIDDLKELLSECDDLVILPLYLYDHSIQSISTASFVGRAHHAEWDSGQVGYIYADRDAILKAYGVVNPDTVQKAAEMLKSETKNYDMYLRGECYGYRLYKDGEEIDSCWGFLGGIDGLKEDLRANLPPEGAELVDQLKYTWETEDAYLTDHDIA